MSNILGLRKSLGADRVLKHIFTERSMERVEELFVNMKLYRLFSLDT